MRRGAVQLKDNTMNKPTLSLSGYIEYLPLWLLSVTPLIFFPYLVEPFELPKFVWILGLTVINSVIYIAISLYRKKLLITFSLPSLAFFLLAISSFLSALFSGNLIEGATHPIGPLLWLAFAIMLTFRPPYHAQRSTHIPFILFPLSFICISLVAVLSRLNILQQIFAAVPYVSSPFFTPSGIALTVLFLMILSTVMVGMKAHEHLKTSKLVTFQLLVVGLCALIVGIISHGSFIATQILNSRYGIRDNWAVMSKTLANPDFLLLGVGPQNYLFAFTQNRPATMNAGPIWNTRASIGTGMFFHITTTLGLIGLTALILLAIRLCTYSRIPIKQLPGLIMLAGFFIAPPNLPFIIALYILIYIYDTKYKTISLSISETIKTIQIPLVFLAVLVGVAITWSFATLLRADAAMFLANQAISNQRADEAYRQAQQSVQLMPFSSVYTRNLSRIQALTAYALLEQLQNEASGSAKAQQIQTEGTRLLEQSIRDGQTATVLNPNNIENWEQLASVYSRLIGVAQGADQWAIDTYLRVVGLDPTNPISRYRLGAIYAATENIDLAISNYLRAIELKADYVDPYVGLAQVYAARGDKQRTLQALDQAILLLPDGASKQQLQQDRQAVVDIPVDQPNQPQPTQTPEAQLDIPVSVQAIPSTNSAEPLPPSSTATVTPSL